MNDSYCIIELASLFLLYLNQYQIVTFPSLRLVTEACREKGWTEEEIANLPAELERNGTSLDELWDQICAE